MKPSIDVVVFLTSMYLSWIERVGGQDSSFEQTKECSTYSEKLVSFPDLHNMIHYKRRRQEDFEIDSVKNTNRERGFYWCELDIEESDTIYRRYRHYGFNSTHWWVEKGCSGWFFVTECRPAVTSTVKEIGPSNVREHDTAGSEEEEDDSETTNYANLSQQSLDKVDKVSPNLAPTSSTPGVHSSQTLTSEGRGTPPQTSLGNKGKVISSVGHSDTMMSYRSNKNAVEENESRGGTRDFTNADIAGHVDVLSPQSPEGVGVDPARLPHPRANSAVVSSNSSIDDMYKGWPLVGYTFPTSKEMWDVLDKATWVDVKAQLNHPDLNIFQKDGARPHTARQLH